MGDFTPEEIAAIYRVIGMRRDMLQDFPVGDRLISSVGYHREGVTGGAEGDDSYASFFLLASFRALTPR